jgi:hemolysin activation/secretion protein
MTRHNLPAASMIWTCAALMLTAAPAWGQSLPGSVNPGRLPQQFRPASRPPPIPNLKLPELPPTSVPPEAAQIRFHLQDIIVDGATVYSQAELLPLYAGLLGKTVTLADIFSVADAITAKYRSDGFILSRAVVVAQRIVGGRVHIRVVEGFVSHVSFQGEDDPAMIRYADQILASRPVKAAVLERYLLLMNDLPGVSVHGILSPAKGLLGGAELTVVIDRTAVEAVVTLDNRGTKYIGPLELLSQIAVNNAFGQSDLLGFQIVTAPANAQELRFYELDYMIPIGDNGLRLSMSVNGSEGEPGYTLQSSSLQTNTSGEILTVRLSQPLIRSRTQNLIADVSFNLTDSYNDQVALPSQTRLPSSFADHVRAIRAGLSYNTTDRWGGIDFIRGELSQGLPIFDASPNGALTNVSRPGGRTVFTKGSIDASRLQDLSFITPGLNLVVGFIAGWSFGQSLLASEQFGLGGAEYGRGYDPSELTGDYGAAGKLELRYDVPPDALAVYTAFGLQSLQLFAFLDSGFVADQNPQLLDQPPGLQGLTSTGIGMRSTWSQSVSASLEVDKPLTRAVAVYADTDNPDPFRVYFSLVARF